MDRVQIQVGPTPNPNAIRVGLSTVVAPKALTFGTAAQAEGHPLAKALFAVPGVASVFMLNNFISITRDPGADWGAIEPRVAQVLESHFNA